MPVRILIVDADSEDQTLVQSLLQRARMVAVPAADAKDAAQILQTQPPPDAIVLDMKLPDVKGTEFLKQIRWLERYNAIPVIILFEEVDPQAIREGLQAGADRYLTKTYWANNLVRTLQEVVEKGRQ